MLNDCQCTSADCNGEGYTCKPCKDRMTQPPKDNAPKIDCKHTDDCDYPDCGTRTNPELVKYPGVDNAPKLLLDALAKIKDTVCGDRNPNWSDHLATTYTRGLIADLIDITLARAQPLATAKDGLCNICSGSGMTETGDYCTCKNTQGRTLAEECAKPLTTAKDGEQVPPLNIYEKAKVLIDVCRKRWRENLPSYASDISDIAHALQAAFEDGVQAELNRRQQSQKPAEN